MSVIYRDRERTREYDDARSVVSTRGTTAGGYTTVKRYRIGGDDSRSTVYDNDRRETRVEETRIVRKERSPSPPPTRERDIIIRRTEREEPRPERDVVIRRERYEEDPRSSYTVVDRRREEPVAERDLVIRRTVERDEPRYERDVRIERYDDRDFSYTRGQDLAPQQDLHRYSRSTEYFSQPQQPQTIVIRNEPIIIRERVRDDSDYAVIRREEIDDRQISRRDPSPRSPDEEYYYERRIRETDGRRDRDEEYYRREVSPHDSVSQVGRGRGRSRDYSSDESMVYVRKEVRETSRSRSESPNHRRHVAEGALAGVGVAELLRHHNKKQGKEASGTLARLGKDVGAGVLGFAAAEGISRAKSRVRSRSRRRDRSDSRDSYRSRRRSRHRSRSRSKSRLRTAAGVGLGAAALAVAAAVARSQRNKSPDTVRRSRSRHRRSSSAGSEPIDDARNPSHRNKRMAEAGVAGAAVAGLIERARSKSRKRQGDRSKSRVRTGLPIAAAGLGSAAIAGLYEKNKAKKEEAAATAERKTRSRSRSRARSVYTDPSAAATTDNMIEYGNDPVYGAGPHQAYYGQPGADNYYDSAMVPAAGAAAGYGAARGERDRSPSRSRDRRRSSSTSSSDGHSRRRRHRRHRSRSQSRDLATAGVAAAGGALAANEYQKRKERKRAEKEAKREERRRREAEQHAQDTFEEGYDPAPYGQPPQDQYYPATNQFPPPPGATPTAQYPGQPQYNPADYQVPPGATPQAGAAYGQNYPTNPAADPYGGRPRRGDENVSAVPSSNTANSFPIVETHRTGDGLRNASDTVPTSGGGEKKVQFAPSVDNEADDSDTTVDGRERRRSRPQSRNVSPDKNRRSVGFESSDPAPGSSSRSLSASSTSANVSSKKDPRKLTKQHPSAKDRSPSSPAPSDDTIELPERFDSRGRKKPDKVEDPLASVFENLLDPLLSSKRDDHGEGRSRRDKRR